MSATEYPATLRTETHEPAFPVTAPGAYFDGHPGMSMREWYAGMALAGIVSNPTWNATALGGWGVAEKDCFPIAARLAYRYADAMLAEAGK